MESALSRKRQTETDLKEDTWSFSETEDVFTSSDRLRNLRGSVLSGKVTEHSDVIGL